MIEIKVRWEDDGKLGFELATPVPMPMVYLMFGLCQDIAKRQIQGGGIGRPIGTDSREQGGQMRTALTPRFADGRR